MFTDENKQINNLSSDKSSDLNNLQSRMSTLNLTIPQSENENNLSMEDFSASTSSVESPFHRRTLRSRKDESMLHKVNRRVIKKPKKNSLSFNSSEKDIKKFYLNKKMTKIKPTCLETIFEENCDEEEIDSNNEAATTSTIDNQVKLVGFKKLKRSLSCSDGFNITKALVQKRKRRVQTMLGSKPHIKKFTMEFFMEKMQSMQQSEDNFDTHSTINDSKSDTECTASAE